MNAWIVGFTLSTGLMAPASGPATATPPPGLTSGPAVGARVIARSAETVLKVGSTVVASERLHRVYRVARRDGPWLWLVSGEVRGWARAEDVIPFDRAIDHFTREIARDPKNAWAFLMRGIVAYDLKDYDRALADDTEAIRLDPKDAVAYHNRGNAWLAKKESGRAIADYDAAIRLDPKDAASYHNRARARETARDYHLAIADENLAIRLDPKDAAKYHLRARAWAAVGAYDQALDDAARAVALDPEDASALNIRAWIWATCPEAKYRSGKQGVEAATRACALTGGRDPYLLGTLAAASAEAGDFRAAVDWQTKALARFRAAGGNIEKDRERLALYRAGKPFRDAPAAP